MWRRIALITAVLGGLLLGVGIALKSDRVSRNIIQHIQAVAAKEGIDLSVQSLEISFFPPAVIVHGVHVHSPNDGPIGRAQDIVVELSPWPSPSGGFVLEKLTLTDVTGSFNTAYRGPQASAPASTPTAAPAPERRSTFDIREFQLSNASLTITHDKTKIQLVGANLGWQPARQGGRDLSLHAPNTVVERDSGVGGQQKVVFSQELTGRAQGSLLQPQQITFVSTTESGDSRIELRGSVTLEPELHFDVAAEAKSHFEALRPWFALPVAVEGDIALSSTVSGTPSSPKGAVNVDLGHVKVGGEPVGNITASVRLNDNLVVADVLRLSPDADGKGLGVLSGKGSLALAPPFRLSFDGTTAELSLAKTLALVGIPGSWTELLLSGDTRVQGNLMPMGLTLSTESTVSNLRVQTSPALMAEPDPILLIPSTDVVGQAIITSDSVSLEGLKLVRGNTSLVAQGTIKTRGSQAGLELQVGGDVDFSDIGSIAGLEIGGRGSLAVAIEGPFADPTITATTTLRQSSVILLDYNREYGGVHLGNTQISIVYHDKRLDLEPLEAKLQTGRMQGSLSIDWRPTIAELRVDIGASAVPLAAVLESLHTAAATAKQFVGVASGRVSISGPLASPTGRFAVSSPSIAVNNTEVGGLTLAGQFGGESPFEMEATLQNGDGGAQATFSLASNNNLRMQMKSQGFPLGALSPFMGEIPITGELHGSADVDHLLDRPHGQAALSIERFVCFDTHLGTTQATGDFQEGKLTLAGTLLDGSAPYTSEINLTRALPYVFSTRWQNLNATTLWPTLSAGVLATAGSLFSQGSLTSADTIQADIEFTKFNWSLGPLSTSASTPVKLQYAQNELHVVDFALKGSGLSFTGSGSVKTTGALNLRLQGGGSVEATGASLGHSELRAGNLQFDVVVGGQWDDPLLGGELSLSNATVALDLVTLEQLNTHATFMGRAIALDRLNAKVASGGKVSGSGQWNLASPSQVGIAFDLTDVTLEPNPETHMVMSGKLSLQGPPNALTLDGALKLQELRYSANMDLERLIQRRNAPPLRVPGLRPDNAMRLRVSIAAPNNILITNNVIETELQGDVMITGTTERLGMLGSVSSLWARARYGDNTYTIDQFSLLFTEEYRVLAEYQLRARTQACNMDVVVDVHGDTMGDAKYDATGTDERGVVERSDVFNCLTRGARLQRGDATTGISQNLSSTAVDALWAVAGLDKEVRRLVPLVDELRLSSAWSAKQKRTTPRIFVGKDVGARLQLSYSQALDEGEDHALSLEYNINSHTALQGNWNSVSETRLGDFGIDLRLRFEFR